MKLWHLIVAILVILFIGLMVRFHSVEVKEAYEKGVKNTTEELGKSYVPPETEEERAERTEQARIQYEAARIEWLNDNPPVTYLFNEDKIYDTQYVIEYLKVNPISGHCALVWRADVVCAEGSRIAFPTSRE